jgi:hypothetical protein
MASSANQLAKVTSIDYPEKKDFELVSTEFGEDIDHEIETWLHDTIRSYKDAYSVLFEQRVPKWRSVYDGKPKDESKSFPWPNASNLVIQLVGQTCDDISSRVLQLIWATSPTAYFRYLAKTKDPKKAADKARIIEQFIDAVAFEPDELDLYRVENVGFSESAKLGTHFFKVIPEKRTEVTSVSVMGDKRKLESTETYNGPKVENLEFEHVLADPDAPTWDKSRLKIHIRPLKKHDLQQRAFEGFYDKDKVESILEKPDRYGPTWEKQKQQSKKGVNTTGFNAMAEWDVYECYFWWYINVRPTGGGKPQKVKAHLVWSYHYETKTTLRSVFNFMPDNVCPIIPTKLDISAKGIHGRGYAEMLDNAQEEVSTQHNQRIDARTMAITGILRSSNPNLDKNIMVYPFCIIPAAKGELEHIKPVQDIGDGGISDENLALQLARERAGVGPAVAGMGAGQTNKKGQYGSMGTLSVMQDGNTRVNHRISDFRHTHIKLISLCTKMYGKMGIGERGELLGLDTPLLREALQDYLEKRIQIPIRAATASSNKEVEKQNSLLLKQSLYQHQQQQVQLVQAILQNQQIPPDKKKWMVGLVASQDAMMKRILRDFGFDQPDEFVPDIQWDEDNQAQQPPTRGGTNVDPRVALIASLQGRTSQGPVLPSGGSTGPNGGSPPQVEPGQGHQ